MLVTPGFRQRPFHTGRAPRVAQGSGQEDLIVTREFGFSTRTRNALRNERDTELLRSELFSIEQLKRHAVTLAGQHSLDPHPGADRLLPRLADNARVLLAAYDVVTAAATSQPLCSVAASKNDR